MSEPFLGEVRMMGFPFAPRSWSQCDGQILPIDQNQSLYSLLGTTFGGDGRTSFALPDLRGRVPMDKGPKNPTMGQHTGTETVGLTASQMAPHTHGMLATKAEANQPSAVGHAYATTSETVGAPYSAVASDSSLRPEAIANYGASQGHENMQPWLAVNFCIALAGVFPSRN